MRKRRIYFDGDRTLVPLANARGVAVIDTDDAHLVVGHNWSLQSGYAISYSLGGRYEFLHRLLLQPGALQVDHINGDPLDNRRANLRLATRMQNAMNARKSRKNMSSNFKGVCLYKRTGKWVAYIQRDGQLEHLGCFANETDAARAYDAAARKHFGDFARLNFPESPNG